MNGDRFSFTIVVTRNFIQDFINSIRNVIGADLPSYEERIQESIASLYDRISSPVLWFRLQITEVTSGAVIITIYGEYR